MGEKPVDFPTWVRMLEERQAAGDVLEPHEALIVKARPRTHHEAAGVLVALPPAPRSRTCLECERRAAHALQAGFQVPNVDEQEICINAEGKPYRTALCARHWDLDWSRRWQKLYDKAVNDEPKRQKLRELAHARARSGRTVHATGWERPAPAPAYAAR